MVWYYNLFGIIHKAFRFLQPPHLPLCDPPFLSFTRTSPPSLPSSFSLPPLLPLPPSPLLPLPPPPLLPLYFLPLPFCSLPYSLTSLLPLLPSTPHHDRHNVGVQSIYIPAYLQTPSAMPSVTPLPACRSGHKHSTHTTSAPLSLPLPQSPPCYPLSSPPSLPLSLSPYETKPTHCLL